MPILYFPEMGKCYVSCWHIYRIVQSQAFSGFSMILFPWTRKYKIFSHTVFYSLLFYIALLILSPGLSLCSSSTWIGYTIFSLIQDQQNRIEHPEINPDIWPNDFWQVAKTFQSRKDSIFNTWCWEVLWSTCKRRKMDPYLTSYAKINENVSRN